jgi:hypothetical protein
VRDGVGDRHRRALRDAEQDEARRLDRVDHRLEVAHPAREAEVGDLAVGEAAAALVVADEAAARRHLAQQWRQTGLSQSTSRCDSQVAALTIVGSPAPLTA